MWANHSVVEPRGWTLDLTEDEANTIALMAELVQTLRPNTLRVLPNATRILKFLAAMKRPRRKRAKKG